MTMEMRRKKRVKIEENEPIKENQLTPLPRIRRRPKNPGVGRSVYQKIFAEHVYRLNLLGATIADLAEFFHVTDAVIHIWRKKYPDFGAAFERGKAIADSRVVEKLYQRAIGYSHPEEKVFLYRGEVIRETVTKHYPPDTGAAAFWLKNRRRGQWKDRHEHEIVPQKVLDSVSLSEVNDDQLNKIIELAGGPEFEGDWKEQDDATDEDVIETKEAD